MTDMAQALSDAWHAGYEHGNAGGSRSADPFIRESDVTRDNDLHIAWDTGWIAGSEDADDPDR